jgi:NAD(P)-dependent dehydrogenase (short-subunit alcohol dehydrogenase family)
MVHEAASHAAVPPRLAGHVALVTGGNTGIGAAIARRLAADGAAVAIGYHEEAGAAAALAAELPTPAAALRCDVTDAGSVRHALEDAETQLGAVTALVNNAAVLQRTPFLEILPEEWDRVVGVSLGGAYLCSRLAIPAMLEAGRGAIVNVASELTSLGGERQAHYVAAKSGIIGLTRSLAREFGPAGIRVNAIAPGPTETRMLSRQLPPGFADAIPLRRLGRPQDMGGAVAFLCSDDAAWITGQVLGINGGIVMA